MAAGGGGDDYGGWFLSSARWNDIGTTFFNRYFLCYTLSPFCTKPLSLYFVGTVVQQAYFFGYSLCCIFAPFCTKALSCVRGGRAGTSFYLLFLFSVLHLSPFLNQDEHYYQAFPPLFMGTVAEQLFFPVTPVFVLRFFSLSF